MNSRDNQLILPVDKRVEKTVPDKHAKTSYFISRKIESNSFTHVGQERDLELNFLFLSLPT